MIFSATDDPTVTRNVVTEARRRGVLVNAADVPEWCDFYLPSFGRRGPLTLAVSSAGKAPGLSRAVKERALAAIGPEWGKLARLLGRLRRMTPAGPARMKALSTLSNEGAAQMLARKQHTLLWKKIRAVWPLAHRQAASRFEVPRSEGAFVSPASTPPTVLQVVGCSRESGDRCGLEHGESR